MRLIERYGEGVASELLSTYGEAYFEHRSRDLDVLDVERTRLADEGMPLHVELGAERGNFLEGLATAYPEVRSLGIEWRPKFVRMGNERFDRRGIENARLLHADAKVAVPILFPLASVQAFYVLFPDPWWKARHATRRLLDPVFMRVLARRLVPGGRIYLKSDVFDYLYRVRASAEVSAAMRPLGPERWPDERDWNLSTRERKCRMAALPYGCVYLERRPDFPGGLPTEPERPEAFPVPDVIDALELIRGPALVDKIARRSS
jgi:tRNA (guanine-N(7)-)-methyltransferase